MAGKLPALLFYPSAWLTDEVSGCSLAAQGLWLRMMIVMHSCTPYGHLANNGDAMSPESIAKRCGCTPEEYAHLIQELDRAGVPRRTSGGIIYSKRMVDDQRKRDQSKRNGKLGGSQLLRVGVNPWDKPQDKTGVSPPIEDRNENVFWGDGSEGGIELPEPLRTPRFRKAYWDFQTHRREKGTRLTHGAVVKQFTFLADLGEAGAIESIEQSIRNGWTGVFPPKGKSGGGTAQSFDDQRRQKISDHLLRFVHEHKTGNGNR